MTEVPAWVAAIMSAFFALTIALVSKWYDKHMEEKYGSKKKLTEAELAVAVERARAENTTEGYLWKRLDALEIQAEALRRENTDLRGKLAKTEDELGDASRESLALSTKCDQLSVSLRLAQEENLNLVRRILTLEGGK